MKQRTNRLLGDFAWIICVSELMFAFQGMEAAIVGNIYPQPNDAQDFLAHILCFDIISNQDCCWGARRALGHLSLAMKEDCENHLSLVHTDDNRLLHSLSFSLKNVITAGWMTPKEEMIWSSPFSFLWDDKESNMMLHDLPLKEVMPQLPNSINHNNQTVTVCIEQSLSGSGMHREINYKLHADRDLKSLDILVHLPADVFINREDAVAKTLHTQLIDIVTTDSIDLEEPTFVSPAHAVVLRFGDTRLDASFSLKLHLRYPQPLEDGDFRRIVLPPSLGVFATVGSDEPVAIVADSSCAQPIMIWTACGYAVDSLWVLVATMGFALAGAAVMLSDLSKVATWI
ncbi:hypothetical protein FisN_18Lu188 [Fistulifera solaris]|uniref:Phosphatidylinositol glycan, class T n=1 Tax=Fistulifera solaris TaxID=1519565 RepID=A0A1Z5JU42_FISSO|nr:hypothetical protein FisN_18Lu188 [Fistulifera solaris]|eukprot:GAX17537.1 hypothetical protein FisN_18Lu188 [Fistulifera solaris]